MDKNIIKVKIKDMRRYWRLDDDDTRDIHTDQRYKEITKNIEEEGFNPEKYGYPEVVHYESNNTFEIKDGNHRHKILKELYGDEYEVDVIKKGTILNIPLGDIFGVFDEEHNFTKIQKQWISIRTKMYGWGVLRQSFIDNNYDPQNFSYIEVKNSTDEDADNLGNVLELPYVCYDGNHRIKILKEIHPPTHTIDVQTQITPVSSCIESAKPTKEDLKKPRKILEYVKGLTMCSYLFIFNLKYTLLMLLVIGLAFILLPGFKKEGEKHIPHNKLRWLYNDYHQIYGVIMTIYHNLRLVICGLTLLIFCGNLVIYDTTRFLIVTAVFLAIQTIQLKFYPEPQDND